MSDSDSFINEVTEEVRRDQLYATFRRYGWIAVVVVLAIVGGAAWNEYSRSQSEAAAQAVGDALLTALEDDDVDARVAALAEIDAEGSAAALVALMTANEQQIAGQTEAAIATLDRVAIAADVPQDYRALASLKSLMLGAGIMDEDSRRAGLEALAVPGNPYRMLALEQLALAEVAAGETDAALARLTTMIEDAEATESLRERAVGLIVALGGELASDPAAN
ncbi:tetratricopeptide repeat protein [Flavimaricola marinus]|uniref:Ancillary SecYEG translocon subunit/Cell division coordinator CpoB TPR domain-containing protein n=1 Tax=Flavimaricola marinus TaxID=1819565 RepID=A0A238LHB8_9RHOB|nr:tetratricopeptide repeat protein [Flavimaricola marinus]SMY09089.1 hypothetical protein LOM8899_03251 [Flavimaricola marinus]